MRILIGCLFIIALLPVSTSGQCHPDRHSTNWFDGWLSCDPAPVPGEPQESGYWILYDFGEIFALGQMHVWNSNDPAHLDRGLRDVRFRVSQDGAVWTDAGSATFAQAPGTSIYEGFPGPDLGGIEGRYLLILAESNWGGDCFGFSELRISAVETEPSSTEDHRSDKCFEVTASPNPVRAGVAVVNVQSGCPGVFSYSLTDVLGRELRAGHKAGSVGEVSWKIDFTDLASGLYYLHVWQGDEVAQIAIVNASDR